MASSKGFVTLPRLPLGNRLLFRLSVALGVGGAVVLLGLGAWNLRLQRAQMTDLVGMAAEGSVETIRRATRDAMLRDRSEEVARILDEIAAQEAVQRIRIFDKQGRIITSTQPHEIGDYVDLRAEQCWGCHAAEEPLQSLAMSARQREFRDERGQHVLGVISPLRNEPDCSTADCHAHPAEQKVLGVLDVQLSLEPVDAHIAASGRQLELGLLALVAALLVVAVWMTWTLVLRPVRRLTRATVKVAAGNLDTRVPVESRTELGLMARSWNEMVEELARARGDLEEWSRTLEDRVGQKTRQLEAAVQQMIVVEKMASLGKLAAVVAHELNNPLTGIGTYARLLRRRLGGEGAAPGGENGGPGEAEILDLIASESARCGEIVRNLLTFSRGSGARFQFQELEPVLQRAAMLVRHRAQMEGAAVEVEVADGLPAIECDPGQLEQMVLALAMNGIEALAPGGKLRLWAGPNPASDGVLVKVVDDGCGIPKDDLHRIFEPFFTTKGEGRGVGLGLAVVYGIVERHHGAIQVDSEPGRGTTFTVHLPRRQPPPAPPPPQPEET